MEGVPLKAYTKQKGEIKRRNLFWKKMYPGNETNRGERDSRNEG